MEKAARRAQFASTAASIPAVLGVVALAGAAVLAISRPIPCYPESCDPAALYRFYAVIGPGALGFLLLVYFLHPRLRGVYNFLQNRWRPAYSYAALGAACAFFFWFILRYCNRQFGGYDFGILIDSGWRLASGQIPYRDFTFTLPPGFYLGVKYAFQLFGVTWDAQLYGAALYACGSFLWIYYLLASLLETRPAAYLAALAIECAAMLLPSFWWYNNITSIAGCIFFLSCLLYVREYRRWSFLATSSSPPEPRPPAAPIRAPLSYAASLFLLGLMKPNTAGLLGLGGLALAAAATRRWRPLAGLTLAAVAAALVALMANGVNPAALIQSYRGAAVDRGGITAFGLNDAKPLDIFRVILCLFALAAPFTLWRDRFADSIRRAQGPQIAAGLLLLLGPAAAMYAIFSNGEFKDVEWPLFICAGVVVLFGAPPEPDRAAKERKLRRFYVAFLCSLVAADLYIGAIRYRVETIGYRAFFEWGDASHPVDSPFFPHLRASARFQAVVAQARQALKENQGPVFFGPRLEFGYAAFGIPSPRNLPVWWHPGTAFARADEPAFLRNWLDRRFATLIFLRNDFTYYSPEFLSLIANLYSRDDRYAELTVFHARPGVGSPLSAGASLK